MVLAAELLEPLGRQVWQQVLLAGEGASCSYNECGAPGPVFFFIVTLKASEFWQLSKVGNGA